MVIEGWIIWLLLGAVLIVAEIFVPSFVLFPVGVGALAGSALAFFGFSTGVQWVVFGLVTVLVALAAWRIIERKPNEEIRKANVEQFIGKFALVIEEIDSELGIGRIRVGQESWRAVSEDSSRIQADSRVRITDVAGTQLVVTTEE